MQYFLIAAFSGVFIGLLHVPAAAQDGVMIQGEEKLPLVIQSGLLGVVLTDEFTGRGDEALRLLSQGGLLPADEPDGQLLFLEATRGPEPAEMLAEAIALRNANPEVIAQAGYVVEFENTNDPVIINDQLIIQFVSGVDATLAEQIAADEGAILRFENPYMPGEYLAAIPSDSGLDTLEVSNALNDNPRVDYAHPNLIRQRVLRQSFVPNDRFFGRQWHHRNSGQSGGLSDADIDSDGAWGLSRGGPGTLIAVLDGGFDMGHPDLVPNYWTNPREIPGNSLDDDRNGQIDDTRGWDFTACNVGGAPLGCGDADPTGPNSIWGFHGTAVAGAAAARGNNSLGVSGTCPSCSILPIRISGAQSAFWDGLAFGYAWTNGASVITNSWGYDLNAPITNNVLNAINAAATQGRGGLGSVVLFAMNTTGSGWSEDCLAPGADISSPNAVIAVGAISNTDQRTPSGYGNCMDLLGPTDNIGALGGTLWGVTTDVQGTAGFNNAFGSGGCPSTEPSPPLPQNPPPNPPPPTDDRNYTFCFNGTSFATPVVAGVAGLVLSEAPNLTAVQVQRVLQDTADKPQDALAAYGDNTGFSAPAMPPAMGFPAGSTHGHGRVNAAEAVRLVAAPPTGGPAMGGRAGTDIVIRDNRLDWGNTEQPSNILMENPRGFIPHYRSADIKVDAPPFLTSPPATSQAFDTFAHEEPLSGTMNRVYVRVRNRGPVPAADVAVKLHWAFAGAGLPALPVDFWTQFPGDAADTSVWHPLGVQRIANLAYSGSSVAGTAQDAAQVVTFDFDAPTFDPAQPNPDHYCLFAVIDSPQDRVLASSMASLAPDIITPRDNNVTHRNVSLRDSGRGGRFDLRFLVSNPFEEPMETSIRIQAPEGWDVALLSLPLERWFQLEGRSTELAELVVQVPEGRGVEGVVEVQQVFIDRETGAEALLGGIDFAFVATKRGFLQLEPADLADLIEGQQILLDRLLATTDPAALQDPAMLATIRDLSRAIESQNNLLLDGSPP